MLVLSCLFHKPTLEQLLSCALCDCTCLRKLSYTRFSSYIISTCSTSGEQSLGMIADIVSKGITLTFIIFTQSMCCLRHIYWLSNGNTYQVGIFVKLPHMTSWSCEVRHLSSILWLFLVTIISKHEPTHQSQTLYKAQARITWIFSFYISASVPYVWTCICA